MEQVRAGRTPRLETPLGPMEDHVRDKHMKLIWGWLPYGNKKPLGSPIIARRLDIKQNLVGGLVSDMRMQRALVGSVNARGYYKIQNEEQLLETISHIGKRIGGLQETISQMYDNYDRYANHGTHEPRALPRMVWRVTQEEVYYYDE
jgi:hypothetical protein